MRFHVVTGPRTSTTEAFAWCPFTTAAKDWTTMMTLRGHTVYLYGGPENEAVCTEFIPCFTLAEQARCAAKEEKSDWALFNRTAARAINKRKQEGDILIITSGSTQKMVSELTGLYSVEYLVGYPDFKRFCSAANYPSHAARNYWQGATRRDLVNEKDSVIGDPFPCPKEAARTEHAGYILYMGRIISQKGVAIVNEVAHRTGKKAIFAGPGTDKDIAELCSYGEYVGVVTGEEKVNLIRSAEVVMVPSQYVEPFARVHIEAQLHGVPVVTSDYGVFPETVTDGRNGYRCLDLFQYVRAINYISSGEVEPSYRIAMDARRNYGFSADYGLGWPGTQYEQWFHRLGLDVK